MAEPATTLAGPAAARPVNEEDEAAARFAARLTRFERGLFLEDGVAEPLGAQL